MGDQLEGRGGRRLLEVSADPVADKRPAERKEARWEDDGALIAPAVTGGHSWHPMAFHPGTKLVYIPAMENAYDFQPNPDFEFRPGHYNTGEDFGLLGLLHVGARILLRPKSRREHE